MRLLCGFIRHTPKDGEQKKEVATKQDDARAREDVQAVLDMMEHRNAREIELESIEQFTLNFDNADLSGVILMDAHLAGVSLSHTNLHKADLRRADMTNAIMHHANLSEAIMWIANLSKADLWDANLSDAQLWEANLSKAILWESNLSNAQLRNADLSEAILANANVSGTDFSGKRTFRGIENYIEPRPVRGLTECQLNQARLEPNPLPDLEGVLDPEGKELKWTGGRGAPLKDDE